MHYFDKAKFEKDLIEYRKMPTLHRMEHLVADYLVPLCRGYAQRAQAEGWVNFNNADPDEAVHIAAIRCWRKLHRFRTGEGLSPIAYFDKIAYYAMLGFEINETKRAQRHVSIDA